MPLQLTATDAQGKSSTATLTLAIDGAVLEDGVTDSGTASADSPLLPPPDVKFDRPPGSVAPHDTQGSATKTLPSALSAFLAWRARRRVEQLPPLSGEVTQVTPSQSIANDNLPLPGRIETAQVNQQWERMQRALAQLDAQAGESIPGTYHGYGIDPGVLSNPLSARHRATPAYDNPLSLTPGDRNLHTFSGLARGLQQIPL